MNAEFAKRCLFQLTIRRVIFDALRIAAEAVALMQHRGVLVRKPRAFVEMTTGEAPEPVEMRLDMPEQFVRQMNPQEVGQRRIGAVEIHA